MNPKKLENIDILKEPEVPNKTIQEAREKPVKILTEKDAYLSEVIDNQPNNLAEIEVLPPIEEKYGVHRLSLPEYFEPFSYDCTRGIQCEFHGWTQEEVHYNIEQTMKRWKQTKRGKYIFRWFLNRKRAIDEAKNLHGWYLVNRTLFSEAPRILFSINGAVEEGDNILGFMPCEKALRKRNRPGELSQEKMGSQRDKFKENPNFYEAKLSPEKADGDDYAPPDALQEGRDF